MNNATLEQWAKGIDESFLLIGAALLMIELAKGFFNKTLKWHGVADMLASLSTQLPFLLVAISILSLFYSLFIYVSSHYIGWVFEINLVSILAAIIVADFLYYWEHRFAHTVRALWVHHAVHHSSRYMNIVTGFRFGPFEGIWSMCALFPMLVIGFAPELIIFGNLVVLAYQTWIHTELIGKLGPVEWVMNTPSHHRVHHGCNKLYLDKNYGGIFIIWDRLFGSFQAENETPRYGLTRDFNSTHPFKVWFSELPAFFKDLMQTKNGHELWLRFFGRP